MSMIDRIMGDVQSFACTWALVGGRLDDGSMYNTAEAQSAELREAIKAAIADAWVAGALSSKVTIGEAERRGAEQMREACAIISDSLGGKIDERDPDEVVLAANSISLAIRAIHLTNESNP